MPTLAVIWRAGGLLFATRAELVVEVLPPLACSPTPGVPAWVRGLFSYRGRLIPLIDAPRLLSTDSVATSADRMANRVLILRTSLGAAKSDVNDCPLGLWVESVLELERLDFDASGAHPGFSTDAGRFLGPITQTRLGQVQLVNPSELFTPEQAAVLSERVKEAAA